MNVSPALASVPDPKVTDHTFYLFDDTDDVTQTLCGVGCGYGPEDHIAARPATAAEGGEGGQHG
jgi:hypothetical protein